MTRLAGALSFQPTERGDHTGDLFHGDSEAEDRSGHSDMPGAYTVRRWR